MIRRQPILSVPRLALTGAACILLSACVRHAANESPTDPIPECEAFLARSRACVANLDSQAGPRADELAKATRSALYASVLDAPSRERAREKCIENLSGLSAGYR